jgi:regulator of protease activity HflC (stomatin/prohibitin superfamily)
MIFTRRVLVGDQERALLSRQGRFAAILTPGEHWIFGRGLGVEMFNLNDVEFISRWSAFLVKEHSGVVARFFTLVETGDAEVAVISFDGKVARVLGPGKRALFWRGPVDVTWRLFDVHAEPEVPAGMVQALARIGRDTYAYFAQVDEGKTGLLFLDNRLVRTLGAGTFAFWTAAASPRVEVVDLRLQTLEIPGQEILTKDKVSLRVNIWGEFQILDAGRAKQSVKDANEHLYRTLQLAVRQTLGKRTLEEVLAEKVDIDQSVADAVRREMAQFGVRVGGIALKDVILPGEMRDILNQVVSAEKQAQANLIRRREETAATRSLLNTARLMEDNPLLVRLKEMETLERVAEKVGKITVHGGFDNLLNDLVTLRSGRS